LGTNKGDVDGGDGKPKRDSSLHRPTRSQEANAEEEASACSAQNDGVGGGAGERSGFGVAEAGDGPVSGWLRLVTGAVSVWLKQVTGRSMRVKLANGMVPCG
jgi:hypothetical protein